MLGRIRQFGRAIVAQPLNLPEQYYLRQRLNPAQQELFLALPIYEQRHAFSVCQTLAHAGFGYDFELLQAALLHDLGKRDPLTGYTISIWLKALNVILVRLIGNRGLTRLSSANLKHRWRYRIWLQITHEARSAELAQKAGSSLRVVTLVSKKPIADPLLEWADDLN